VKAIRNEYAALGVDNYYQNHAQAYENPHFPYIQSLLEKNKPRLDYTHVLDLSCGGGEVTLILRGMGFDNTIGCDPFTYNLFEKNTGNTCWQFSFEDIVKGKMTPLSIEPFTAIICSFAMHLCPSKMLQPLAYQLFIHSKNIVIITPHKRPELEKIEGIELQFEDFTLTDKGKKVFLKSYTSLFTQSSF
jgi:SAM-dependent methyltransferase